MGILIGFPILASATIKVWDGRGTNTLWSNPTNWVDDIAPTAGDDLVFPPPVGRVIDNDLPAGTHFNSILITGYSYGFSGKLVALSAGLTNAPYQTIITLPIRLEASQTFHVSSNFSPALEIRSGGIDLNGYELTLGGEGQYLISSTISGGGALIQRTPQSVILAGSNSFTGALRVEAGVLTLQHLRALGDSAGPTELGPGTRMTLNIGGVPVFDEPLMLAGGSRVIGGTWNGPVTLTGQNVELSSSPTINGPISGSGGIVLVAVSSMLTLNGTNTYTGTNRITTGTLVVNGDQPGSEVYIASQGVLTGIGRVGPITCPSGQVRPGRNNTAAMTCGNLNLSHPGALVMEIKGPVAGVNYDQLRVIGTVSLGNGLLTLSNSFAASPGDEFVIIDNDGSDPIDGTFGGLPEGIPLVAGNVRFRISYVGGDGNDVVLTALPLPPPSSGITRVWDGGGANHLWSTPENWMDDTAPAQGDDLEFPAGAGRLATVNDFAANTTFNSIRLTGDGYRLEGAAIALNAGISDTHTAALNEVNLPLILNTNQTFRNTSAPLRIGGGIDTAGSTLTLDHDGELKITGAIFGSGALVKTRSGQLFLTGANTFSGPADITAGELIVSNSVVFGDPSYGTSIRSNALLTLYGDITLEPLTLDGRLRSLGESEATTNRISAPVTLTRSGVDLQISNVLVIDGAISGSGQVDKFGAGTLVLNGTNTYFSSTFLNDGTLVINGSVTNGIVYLTNGTLGGTGWVQYIQMSGNSVSYPIVSPGLDHPGILTVYSADLRGFSAPNVARLVLQLNGTRPGIDYDQLRIDGADVRDVLLELSLGFTPQVGDHFVIVDKLTPNEVVGPFLGLRQGAVFMVGQTQFQISYRGGDGNDVELTVTEDLPLTRTWDGGGTNRLWSNPQNWIGHVAPSGGETLVFPRYSASPISTRTTNDLPADTGFRRVIFDGNWSLYGASISLDFGILAYDSATVALPLNLRSNLAFICDAHIYADDPIVDLLGRVDLTEHELTVRGSGKWRLRGQLESGTLVKSGAGRAELYTNNLHGQTFVSEGELVIYHTNALSGTDFGTDVAAGAQLTLATRYTIPPETLLLAGTLGSENSFTTFTNHWSGNITLQGVSVLMNTSNALFISGSIQGPADLIKAGSGSLVLLADNTYTGSTIVTNGSLYIQGSQPQSAVILRAGGIFGGRGFAGPLFATNGFVTISPGGTGFGPSFDYGTLSCRDLTISSNGILVFNSGGPIAGTEYDQLNVSGAVRLTRPRLVVQTRFIPLIGQSLILIDNDESDPINGTFGGLPEGAFVVQSNILFQITYAGGDGNDVALTRLAAPPSTLSSITRQPGSMLLEGFGISNLAYTVQAASNLNTPIFWESIGTSSANRSNVYQFIDTNSPLPMRFYRVVSP